MKVLLFGATGGTGRHVLTRADTAHFIVDQLTDPSYIRKVALLAY